MSPNGSPYILWHWVSHAYMHICAKWMNMAHLLNSSMIIPIIIIVISTLYVYIYIVIYIRMKIIYKNHTHAVYGGFKLPRYTTFVGRVPRLCRGPKPSSTAMTWMILPGGPHRTKHRSTEACFFWWFHFDFNGFYDFIWFYQHIGYRIYCWYLLIFGVVAPQKGLDMFSKKQWHF